MYVFLAPANLLLCCIRVKNNQSSFTPDSRARIARVSAVVGSGEQHLTEETHMTNELFRDIVRCTSGLQIVFFTSSEEENSDAYALVDAALSPQLRDGNLLA
jgi:hypothetical protein